MPQIRIEYSPGVGDGFDRPRFARQLHEYLVEIAKADLASCKTRFTELGEAVIADGSAANAMIHVEIGILSGRSEAQKRQLGEAAMNALQGAVRKSEGQKLQLTVEIRDMDRGPFQKRVL